MEVVIWVVVLSETAAIPSAQEVAAELGGYGDIGDVRVEGGGEVGGEGGTRRLRRKGTREEEGKSMNDKVRATVSLSRVKLKVKACLKLGPELKELV